jgi:hypothetical protein
LVAGFVPLGQWESTQHSSRDVWISQHEVER